MKKLQLISAVMISTALVACGGGDPKSSSKKPGSLLPPEYIQSSSSSSSVPSNIVNETIPFHENFDNAVNTAGFFTANYKGLNTDSSVPFYYATGGFVDEFGNQSPTSTSWITGDDNRKLQIGNGRFTFGQTRLEAGTTDQNPDTPTWGEFDLSKPYKISFCVVEAAGASSSNFEIYVDNNTTGGNNSRYGGGNASRIFQVPVTSLTPGQRASAEIPSALSDRQIGTSTSFFQFRVSSGGFAVIDDLVVEYVGEPHGLNLPNCVAETSLPPAAETAPPAPAAPSVASGNGELTVSWTSVGVGVTYEVFYNTTDSAEGAIPFAGNPVEGTSAQLTGLTNGTTYYVFVRGTNAIGVGDYSPSTASTPSLPPVVNPGESIVTEDFTAADTATFFSAAYKSLPGDAGTALYFPTAGETRITLADGALSMSNARFTIGDKGTPTAAGVQPNGVFDLTRPYRITFTVTEATGSGNFQIYVDNNTTSAGSSIHAEIGSTASRLLQMTPADISSFPHEVSFESSVGTATSFFQLRADSGITSLTIRDLVIEYVDGGEVSDGLLNENFDAAVDYLGFFSADYKALPNDPGTRMYADTAGGTRVSFADGALSMFNARFTIGDKGTPTAADAQPDGVFDLTQPYRLKFKVLAAEGTGNFQVYVDNNTTSAGNSIHASIGSTASRILQMTPADITSFPYEVVIESSVGTATSFFQIRADSGITNLTIDDLVLEYQ